MFSGYYCYILAVESVYLFIKQFDWQQPVIV